MLVREMKPFEIPGIYSTKTKVFYYLESGHSRVMRPQERLIHILGLRRLIESEEQSANGTRAFKLMSMQEAKDQNYDIEPIYFSELAKAVASKNPETNVWKR